MGFSTYHFAADGGGRYGLAFEPDRDFLIDPEPFSAKGADEPRASISTFEATTEPSNPPSSAEARELEAVDQHGLAKRFHHRVERTSQLAGFVPENGGTLVTVGNPPFEGEITANDQNNFGGAVPFSAGFPQERPEIWPIAGTAFCYWPLDSKTSNLSDAIGIVPQIGFTGVARTTSAGNPTVFQRTPRQIQVALKLYF